MRIIGALITVILLPTVAEAEPAVPNADLRVAVQQKESGKLDGGLHLLELFCWDGRCSLTSVSLNQCGESGDGKPAFYPKARRAATADGTLSVQAVGNTIIATEVGSDIGGDYTTTLRFEYAPPRADGVARRLVGFSGGFVKNSAILQKVLTVEYVALSKRSQVVSFDCGVLLPGVDRE